MSYWFWISDGSPTANRKAGTFQRWGEKGGSGWNWIREQGMLKALDCS